MAMSGVHRRPETPLTPLARMQVLATTVVIGAYIYVIVAGTSLEAAMIFWLVSTTLAVDAIVRRRVDRGIAWLWVGAAVSTTLQLVSSLAKHGGWPAGQRHLIAVAGDWVQALLIAIFVAAVAFWIKSSALTWPPWRATGKDRPEPG